MHFSEIGYYSTKWIMAKNNSHGSRWKKI